MDRFDVFQVNKTSKNNVKPNLVLTVKMQDVAMIISQNSIITNTTIHSFGH